MSDPPTLPSRRKVFIAVVVALLTATALLFGVILPAEYGVDPLGTGELLGLLALGQARPIVSEEGEYRVDQVELPLYPGEWVEYFYRLEEGGSMLFTWAATGPVSYNFHAAPDGAPAGYAESFDGQESEQGHGTYTAPFSGIHGWYWENVGAGETTITLTTAGFYTSAEEGRARANGYKDLTDIRGNPIPNLP